MANNVKIRDSANKAIMRYMKTSDDAAIGKNIEQVESYLQLLDEQWARFTKSQEAVENACGDEALPMEEATRVQTECWYVQARANFRKFLRSENESQKGPQRKSISLARLPQMELPTFSGASTEWVGFYLHYLRSCLKGEALRVVDCFELSNANYKEAWELLRERYNVMRIIVDQHLAAITLVKKASDDSADAIKGVIDNIRQHVHALNAIGRPVQFWDDWLVHVTVSKLAFETRKQWELSLGTADPATFEELLHFLEIRCRSLEATASSKQKYTKPKGVLYTSDDGEVQVNTAVKSNIPQGCLSCGESHKLYVCERFNSMSASSRLSLVKEKGACYNCLSRGHTSNHCRSQSNCRICNYRHHTLLHNQEPMMAPVENETQVASLHHAATYKQILLATARIRIKDREGRWQTARALFDNGSHISLITEACVLRLGINQEPSKVVISGIGNTIHAKTSGKVILTLSHRQKEEASIIEAYTIPKITSNIPAAMIQTDAWIRHVNVELADPEFFKPGPIDILIGMDVMEKFILPELRKGSSGMPLAQSTTFGWILSGRVDDDAQCQPTSLVCNPDYLTETISKLWEMDQFPKRRFLTDEESLCEQHFTETHRRTGEGRFIVKLPFKKDVAIGETKTRAERQFLRLENSLMHKENVRSYYANFMQELLDLGHMEATNETPSRTYYMPHHAVIKESSATTKLRVVFNASSKSASGNSLNDALLVGPQLQQDLFTILVRFRSHQFAMTADIEKMYRQVLVDDGDADFQRILWRSDPSEELTIYRILRVTYGVASASYLVVRAMQEAALNHQETSPTASKTILRDFYMDDLLTGANTESELLELRKGISNILSSAGFNLRKWASNCKSLAEALPGDLKELPHYAVDAEEVRTLGLTWNIEHDYLTYAVSFGECPPNLTKRKFLSDASRLFDPVGLLAPCTVMAKLWFQKLWNTGVNWDDPLPDDIAKQWRFHRNSMVALSQLKLGRWIGFRRKGATNELHVFADASERAYAAAIYARVVIRSEVAVTLVAAKAKVAPIKTISLPRLELCAAHLAAKLTRQVTESLDQWTFRVFAWSDSTITLAWLQEHPSRWATFIANRVADIQEVLPGETWSHVRSEENPADCASRGVTAEYLLQHDLWWKGPDFLRQHAKKWTIEAQAKYETDLELKNREKKAHLTNVKDVWGVLAKYASYNKLKRIIAYVSRFLCNTRQSALRNFKKMIYGPITFCELHHAENALLRYTQQLYFPLEISNCKENKPVSMRSSLRCLQPFIDKNGVLRVGGRLSRLPAGFDVKHPIILPKGAALSRLIVTDLHLFTLHGGPQLVQVLLHRRFWIPGSRNLIRSIYRNCVKCTIVNRRPMQQLMAELPSCRLTYVRCFLNSAVDFAGPFSIKFSAGRGAKTTKGYVSSFVCMGTGAMHLELVSDLSTASFLNAFKRFVNRRGICRDLYSDNGTNFVGAERELRKMFEEVMKDRGLSSYFADTNVNWHFNPPNAPHMGGYWETGIKRVKYYLRRTLNDHLLTFEEFSTLLTEIESCVNSRPLCVHAPDATDAEILTPGHFVIGEPLKCIPEPSLDRFNGGLSQRWQLISAMRRQFWKRWRDEYIISLQKRRKWLREKPNLKENDVVIVLGERTPPTKWKLGRVVRCSPGVDGLVRVATVKTADGELIRPIHKLCVLPTEEYTFNPEPINVY